ncbi:MAG: hypothetical protein E6I75_20360 [Chloroflexi bacterium]|nr:MAG: hypothetical protein E6I75_20360 [Chloroflexota bacterium]
MNTASMSQALTVKGNQIVKADGQPVTLRGFGLGGWPNMENFITEDDVRFVSSLGLNLVRLPINYRHFEDDMHPFVLKEEGLLQGIVYAAPESPWLERVRAIVEKKIAWAWTRGAPPTPACATSLGRSRICSSGSIPTTNRSHSAPNVR